MDNSSQRRNNNDVDGRNRPVRIVFVHVGLDLPKSRITLLSARATEKGATVLATFRSPTSPTRKRRKRAWWQSTEEQQQQQPARERQPRSNAAALLLPTHLVIGEDCSAQQVAEKLNFSSVDEFERFVRAVSDWRVVICFGYLYLFGFHWQQVQKMLPLFPFFAFRTISSAPFLCGLPTPRISSVEISSFTNDGGRLIWVPR